MGETLIKGLIGFVLLVGAVFLVLWVIAQVGVTLPSIIVTIIWIVVALIAVLFIYRAIGGSKLF